MKILILTGDYPTPELPFPSVFVHNQAKALQARGVDVSVLRFDVRSPRKRRPPGFSTYTIDGITVYRYSIPCGPIPYLLPRVSARAALNGFARVKKLIGSPDLIHAHFFNAGACAEKIKQKYGVPYVITEHGSGVFAVNRSPEILKQCRLGYAGASALLAVGGALRAAMGEITDRPVTVVPNILPPFFHYEPKAPADRPLTFLSVGNLNAGKRFDLTLTAFAGLKKNHPDAQLKIAGGGPLAKDLKQLAGSLGIADSVQFLGLVDNRELPALYRRCDCFVLPSDFETFGVVYAEAAACGLPVIATDCGGPADIVTPENGLLIPKGDAAALQSAMEQVLARRESYDPELISRQTLAKFGEDVVANAIIAQYRAVLNCQIPGNMV